MITEERRQLILRWISDEDSISLEELMQRLNVSAMTIRRDFNDLQEEGLIKRVRGGAIKADKGSIYQPQYNARLKINHEAKVKIARYAVQHFVNDKDIIILEGGTTIGSMGSYLNISNLTIMTNALKLLPVLSNYTPTIELLCCGGIVYSREFTFVGPQAEVFFKAYKANKCFFGASGLTIKNGITTSNLPEVGVKKSMLECAEQRIFLVDSSKFGISSLISVCPLEEINILITDNKSPQDILDYFNTHR